MKKLLIVLFMAGGFAACDNQTQTADQSEDIQKMDSIVNELEQTVENLEDKTEDLEKAVQELSEADKTASAETQKTEKP